MSEHIKHSRGIFSSLTKQQKEAIWLLFIGTFALGYWSNMITHHIRAESLADTYNLLALMGILASISPYTILSFAVFVCCFLIFLFVGPVILGYKGDHFGRKSIVATTTLVLAISCVFTLVSPHLLCYAPAGFQILLTHSFTFNYAPEIATLCKHFPVLKRCTMIFLSGIFSCIILIFFMPIAALFYIKVGSLVILIPIVIGFVFGLLHFEKLEKKTYQNSLI